ncbi:MAG: RimK family alpha-L-glutamate ligase [Desulfobacteraceae bacterium]|nr:RimK family alpha-L-glutamate ligase [Desulfobacteraceae bacterium]
MKIGILTINDFNFHPNMRFQQAADKQGHQIVLINPYHLFSTIKNNAFGFSIDGMTKKPDIILPRQGSPMGDYGLCFLRQFTQMGIPLINGLEGVTITRSQYITLQALAASGIPAPSTCFITDKSEFPKAVDFLGGYPVVVKQVDGMGGDGVIKVDTQEDVIPFLNKHLKDKKGIVVQEFIPPQGRIDIRLLVIGNKVAGAMKLEPGKKDFRANINQNGHAEMIEPSPHWIKLAVDSAKACCLEIAGVDMIVRKDDNPKIIEVNYSPGFKGLEAATGLDIAKEIIEYASSNLNKKR